MHFSSTLLAASMVASFTQTVGLAQALAVSNAVNAYDVRAAVSDILTGDPGARLGFDVAQPFSTGSFETSFYAVTLAMNLPTTDGGGFTVSLYEDNAGSPGVAVGVLTGSPNPEAGYYVYAPTAVYELGASTTYWLVASVAHSEPDKSYLWSGTTSPDEAAAPGWSLGTYKRLSYVDGVPQGPWESVAGTSLITTVHVLAVPEPEVAGLAVGVGILAIGVAVRRPWIHRSVRSTVCGRQGLHG